MAGEPRRRAQEELLDSRLTIGQAIAEKPELALEARVGRDRMMRRGIQRVVNRNAIARAE